LAASELLNRKISLPWLRSSWEEDNFPKHDSIQNRKDVFTPFTVTLEHLAGCPTWQQQHKWFKAAHSLLHPQG
jgi:hypothetical protein